MNKSLRCSLISRQKSTPRSQVYTGRNCRAHYLLLPVAGSCTLFPHAQTPCVRRWRRPLPAACLLEQSVALALLKVGGHACKSPGRGPFWLSWGTTERRVGGVGGRNALHADGMREELAIAAGFAALLLGGCASMERGGISKKNVEKQLS